MRTLFFLVLTLLLSVVSIAADEGDPLREKAQKGDEKAQLELAHQFFYGKNRPRNLNLGAYWFKQAAERGSVEGHFNLGVCYEYGYGAEASKLLAFEHYQKAGKLPEARFKTALFYASGLPAERSGKIFRRALISDREKSNVILNDLIRQQYPPALTHQAQQLLNQQQVSKENAEEAFRLLTIASEQNDPVAVKMLADCYYRAIGTREDPEKMFKLLEKSRQLGDPEAVSRLAFCYEYGVGTAPDMQKALELYQQAADLDIAAAQVKLGDHYLSGFLIPSDVGKALSLYQSAMDKNFPQAFLKLGLCYASGIGVEKNAQQAFLLFLKGAALMDAECQYNLSVFFREGRGSAADPTAVVYWLKQAADQGHSVALRELAICHIEGYGTPKNVEEGNRLLREAAEIGDPIARNLLQE